MTDALVFALTALCAYRIWRLWALDILPPVKWAREHAEAFVYRHHGDGWADGVTCSWCMGAWISFATVAAVWAARPLPLPALWFLAVSTVVGLLSKVDQ